MLRLFFLCCVITGCAHQKRVVLGVVDSREETVCVLQLANGSNSIIHVHPAICENMKEGDILELRRNENR